MPKGVVLFKERTLRRAIRAVQMGGSYRAPVKRRITRSIVRRLFALSG